MKQNCHGCKWLDESCKGPAGDGYCAMVERSARYIPGGILNGRLEPSDKVRRPEKEQCELYEPGDFNTRFSASGK